jgi:peptide-methionine (S)-S-oxide reductase
MVQRRQTVRQSMHDASGRLPGSVPGLAVPHLVMWPDLIIGAIAAAQRLAGEQLAPQVCILDTGLQPRQATCFALIGYGQATASCRRRPRSTITPSSRWLSTRSRQCWQQCIGRQSGVLHRGGPDRRRPLKTGQNAPYVQETRMAAASPSFIHQHERNTMTQETAILAGGCFWGMQDLVRKLPGVVSTRVGYSGGDIPNATYRNHGTHAEAIEIVFDPAVTSYRAILEFFFQVHDPSTPNRQGNDRGMSYRSGIYFTSDAQRDVALDTIADVDASGLWPGKVVTEVKPAGDFWEAEPEHQDYLVKHPNGYTCHFIRKDWKLPVRADRVA